MQYSNAVFSAKRSAVRIPYFAHVGSFLLSLPRSWSECLAMRARVIPTGASIFLFGCSQSILSLQRNITFRDLNSSSLLSLKKNAERSIWTADLPCLDGDLERKDDALDCLTTMAPFKNHVYFLSLFTECISPQLCLHDDVESISHFQEKINQVHSAWQFNELNL